MYFDIHAHFEHNDLKQSIDIVKKAISSGVKKIAAVSENRTGSEKNLLLKKEFPENILTGCGFHPAHLASTPDDLISEELEYIQNNCSRFDMIGEVGYDFCRVKDQSIRKKQVDFFEGVLEAAAVEKKVINIHSRWALRKTLERVIQFKKQTGINAVMHWFTQSKKLIRLANDNGIYVSVGPTLLFFEETSSAVKEISSELLLTETDSPVPFNGRNASPEWIPDIVKKLAKVRNCGADEMKMQLKKNFNSFISSS
ncbi:MAG: TatD family hydrolase [Actinomycetia bacterium]|nr:TatD family hydrolase [Actinomycetes bacterium]